MTTFGELGLSEAILKAVQELGYEEPTPIQSRTIGVMLTGNDLIAQAQTGTGKTAAFALPMIDKVDHNAPGVQSLVLTPTRELAVQVSEAISRYGKYCDTRALPIYGGQSIDLQLRALRRGVHIVVGTPGRLLDHMRRGTLDLSAVRTIVLDEADEMLNMGFIEDIEAILQAVPETRQTALFSATMPHEIVALAQRYMRTPEQIKVANEQLTVPQIRQLYYEVAGRDKIEALARILDMEMPTSAIIFCRTKAGVDELGERLGARGYGVELLHGDLSQAMRDRVMKKFRENQVELLVATDVAARGLDVEHVSHVINFDIPMDPESYVHRIGRTGRAGRAGEAITLVSPRERRMLKLIERLTSSPIQRMRLPTIADVIARRRENFKDALRDLLNEPEGLEPYVMMAEELGEEFDSVTIAAAAFKLLLAEPEEQEDKLQQIEEIQDRGPRRPQGQSFGPQSGMQRLFINVGREERVRPADLVGAIANEAGIPGRAIGAIDIFDHFSFVEVPSEMADRVLQALNKASIRGRDVEATLAKPRRDGPPGRR
jgi:ATP-dependent RNA helicase DeaD